MGGSRAGTTKAWNRGRLITWIALLGGCLVVLAVLPAATAVPMDPVPVPPSKDLKQTASENTTFGVYDTPAAPLPENTSRDTERGSPPGDDDQGGAGNGTGEDDDAEGGNESEEGDPLLPSLPGCSLLDLPQNGCEEPGNDTRAQGGDPAARDEPNGDRNGDRNEPAVRGDESGRSAPSSTEVSASATHSRKSPLPEGATEAVTTTGLVAILWTLFVASPRPIHRTVRAEPDARNAARENDPEGPRERPLSRER